MYDISNYKAMLICNLLDTNYVTYVVMLLVAG